MQIDLDYIRRHYTSLSDEALLDVDRNDLVEGAQQVYDEELARRPWLAIEKPAPQVRPASELPIPEIPSASELAEERRTSLSIPEGAEEAPEWLADAGTACGFSARYEAQKVPMLVEARHALTAAGIPNHLVVERVDPEPETSPYFDYELKVPGLRVLEAVSTLDVDVFNPQSEREWRSLFATMSDAELLDVEPRTLVRGWRDRIARMLLAYREEMDRRGFPPLSADERHDDEQGVA